MEMKKENDKVRINQSGGIFLAGLFLVCISAVLYGILGTDSVVAVHDQLDGEVPGYLYQAKYLFRGNTIPELMNAVGKEALMAPAPILILLYKLLPPFGAFLLGQYLVMLAGYVGMVLLLRYLRVPMLLACFSGLIFAYLPLLPVYGLSMYGMPLAAWAFLKLKDSKNIREWLWPCLTLMLYAAASSPVLCGFAVLFAAAAAGAAMWMAGKTKFGSRGKKGYLLGMLLLLLVYILCNSNLLVQLLNPAAFVSHKEEVRLAPLSFFDTFRNTFLHGAEHARAWQEWCVLLAVLVLIAGLFVKKLRNETYTRISILVLSAVLIALFYAVWNWEPVIEVRRNLGGVFVWFQLERFYWLLPAVWYTILGLCLGWLWELGITKKAVRRSLRGGGLLIGVAAALTVLYAGNWKQNVQKLVNADYPAMSWKDFYAEDVFSQIQDYIDRPLSEYRVASLGIFPAAALYNGFYCLDGYSNNYPLEYKHSFREIIEPELAKNDYIREYFDGWGNRCYLLASETPGYFKIEKGKFYYSNYEINTAAFRKMGGDYLLSAAYIENAEKTGLKLLRQEPFQTQDSYYQIYLYGIME